MRTRARWGLTRAAWDKLDEDEREEMLAWDYHTQRALSEWRAALSAGQSKLTAEAATLILVAGLGG